VKSYIRKESTGSLDLPDCCQGALTATVTATLAATNDLAQP